jgi:HemY protein
MRAALWLLALFAMAVAFTLAARLDQGYVIVVYPPWRMELSFMLALLLLLSLLALAYAVTRLADIALNLSGDVRAWRLKKRKSKADQAFFNALRAYLDGDFARARTLAAKAGESDLAPDLVERLLHATPVVAEAASSIPRDADQPAA